MFDTNKRTYVTAVGTFVLVVAGVAVLESASEQSQLIDPALTLIGAIVSAVLVAAVTHIS